jgi:hypothetical protein
MKDAIAFDRLAAFAARLLAVPLAIVSLDEEGRPAPQAAERFAFHAAEPLHAPDGSAIGTLHVFDHAPRAIERLSDLAAFIGEQVEFRRAARRLVRTGTVLREVSEGLATATGDSFFPLLVRQLTHALGVDYAFVAEVAAPGTARILATSTDDPRLVNVEYPLSGTPCQEVLTNGFCSHPRGVAASFPDDPLLAELHIESYMGTQLCCAHGDRLGWLAIMDRKPIVDVAFTESLLQIFALRAAAELHRRTVESQLRQAHDEMERTVTERTRALEQAERAVREREARLANGVAS